MEPFGERWQLLWQDIGTAAPAGLLDALLAAWCEPQRHYHTLQHLEECLLQFDVLATWPRPTFDTHVLPGAARRS